MKTQEKATLYKIKLKGYLGDDVESLFNNFKAEYTPDGDTVLTGPVIDQAELHGILMRIRDLGLVLVLVQQINGEDD
ncbi:MAG: hypothetical protein CL609_06040 [Anaerolineaceae bacterium]|nr:hypothetical protein [Anaerolineaceae bacterium]